VEQHLLESGQMLQTHEQITCIGQWCAVHRPMPGPWAAWPRYWEQGVLHRTCPCGFDHPVAEMYTWAVATGQAYLLQHPCCGIHPCTPLDGGSV
jgi:hypothetical protein